MSSTVPHRHAPDFPPGVRPLPSRPSLEYERKQAKRLLTALRRGDPEALRRASLHGADAAASQDERRLADAQFIIAREYGFRSWPRLVEYFTTLERHVRSEPIASYRMDQHEQRVLSILAGHRNRRPGIGLFLGAFVPRFFGMKVDDIFASTITVDDARVVVAREHMCASWEALAEASKDVGVDGWERYQQPLTRAFDAIKQADLAAMSAILDEHPEILNARASGRHTLISSALVNERRERTPEAKAVTEWLIARGADPTETLNRALRGWFRMTTDDVRFHLDRGADPNWMPPNGITILEHAIYRYWNAEGVDLIASRVTPRKAFWIAAGLGDVNSVKRYLDRDGRPIDAARRHRPDFTAMGPPLPQLPDADDLEILWEAFFVAGLNTRVEVLDLLLEAGLPIDYSPWSTPLLNFAVGNRLVGLVEYLVSRGANLDARGYQPSTTAREAAEEHYAQSPSLPETLRILQLCGGRDPETVLRLAEEKRSKSITVAPKMREAAQLACEEAARLGQTAVEPHNLLTGILRQNENLVVVFLANSGVDIEQLRKRLNGRLIPGDVSNEPDYPPSPEVARILAATRAQVDVRRQTVVTTLHLLWALVTDAEGSVAAMLADCGANLERLRAQLGRA
jgi:hypothetical protein